MLSLIGVYFLLLKLHWRLGPEYLTINCFYNRRWGVIIRHEKGDKFDLNAVRLNDPVKCDSFQKYSQQEGFD